MTTKTNAVKKYRHCYEASEEGSWLVEVTEKSHLSCSGKKDLRGRVLCRRQQSTQQLQESMGFDYNLRFLGDMKEGRLYQRS